MKSKATPRFWKLYARLPSDDYRAIGLLENDTVIWIWIGNHDEYQRLLR